MPRYGCGQGVEDRRRERGLYRDAPLVHRRAPEEKKTGWWPVPPARFRLPSGPTSRSWRDHQRAAFDHGRYRIPIWTSRLYTDVEESETSALSRPLPLESRALVFGKQVEAPGLRTAAHTDRRRAGGGDCRSGRGHIREGSPRAVENLKVGCEQHRAIENSGGTDRSQSRRVASRRWDRRV